MHGHLNMKKNSIPFFKKVNLLMSTKTDNFYETNFKVVLNILRR